MRMEVQVLSVGDSRLLWGYREVMDESSNTRTFKQCCGFCSRLEFGMSGTSVEFGKLAANATNPNPQPTNPETSTREDFVHDLGCLFHREHLFRRGTVCSEYIREGVSRQS